MSITSVMPEYRTNPVTQDAVSYEEPFENVLKELYALMEGSEHAAVQSIASVAQAERMWNELLSDKVIEAQRDVAAAVLRQTNTASISSVIAPLSIAAQGVLRCISGRTLSGVAAMAFGGVLALDALFGAPVKSAIAGVLGRMTGESDAAWAERVTVACSFLSVATSFSSDNTNIPQLAVAISNAVVEGAHAVTSFSVDRQKAFLLDVDTKKDVSLRNLQTFTEQTLRYQRSAHEYLQEISAFYQARRAVINDLFT